ncbi:MAG: SRPBCC domain-containing protein [Acidobacteria bacterium]|nr:SRPBCC domain-containing protein [Acidobacteriota bacterium]
MATVGMTPQSQISPDNDRVACEIFIAAPRERIFEALTDPNQAIRWWGQKDRYQLSEFIMDVRVGGKWSTSGGSMKMGHIDVHGEFLEIDPPLRLKYTWISSWMPKSTMVLWELEEKDNGTLVKLTHTGFAGDAGHAKAHSDGWNLVLSWLEAYLERGETVGARK